MTTTPAIAVLVVSAYVLNWVLLLRISDLYAWVYEKWPRLLRDWPLNYPWFVPLGIAGAPLCFPFRWMWLALSKTPSLAILPEWIQIVAPPVILLAIAVELRGVVARLSALVRVMLIGAELGCAFVFCWPDVRSQAPAWMLSSFFSWSCYSYAALVTPWLGEKGRGEGFVWTAMKLVTGRFYGPGGLFQLNAAKRPQPFGSARTAKLDEISKGGLLG